MGAAIIHRQDVLRICGGARDSSGSEWNRYEPHAIMPPSSEYDFQIESFFSKIGQSSKVSIEIIESLSIRKNTDMGSEDCVVS